MKGFHIHIGVKDINHSILFYSALFGQKPTKVKDDYAKWMLEDPRINFAISTRSEKEGLDHLGMQVSEEHELVEISERLKKADLGIFDEGSTTCCYAESSKAWIKDPAGIAWETFLTMADTETFNGKANLRPTANACCAPKAPTESNCC